MILLALNGERRLLSQQPIEFRGRLPADTDCERCLLKTPITSVGWRKVVGARIARKSSSRAKKPVIVLTIELKFGGPKVLEKGYALASVPIRTNWKMGAELTGDEAGTIFGIE